MQLACACRERKRIEVSYLESDGLSVGIVKLEHLSDFAVEWTCSRVNSCYGSGQGGTDVGSPTRSAGVRRT